MLKNAKYIKYLSAICSLVYFTSYITRINYGAIVAEIVAAEGISKSSASFVLTAGFISYGIGQLISGFMGDRLDPKKVILSGLLTTSVFNFLIPFSKTVLLMTIIWLFNGFAQSMMWPPLVKIMSNYFSKEDFQQNCVRVSIASSAGTIAVYLFSPIMIHLSGWKSVFFVSGIFGIIVSIIWMLVIQIIENHANMNMEQQLQDVNVINKNENISFKEMILSSGVVFIIIGIIMQGVLKDGITTWMPSYVNETFHLSSSVSILSAVILPIFSIFCYKLTLYLKRKFFSNELSCATVMFFAGFCAIIILMLLNAQNILLSVILVSIITGSMHGVNLMLISFVPGHFNKFGNVSWISGLLNFFTYVGSALSTYVFAKLSEVYGWQFTIFSWGLIALLGTTSCFACIKKWGNFVNNINFKHSFNLIKS